MIPMGTVVTVCMLLGVVGGLISLIWPRSHGVFTRLLGVLVLLAGMWNVFWYWLRHPVEYWGLAALVSGLLMIFTAGYLLAGNRVSGVIRKLKPVVLSLLAAAFLHYANTIYHL